MFTMEDAMKQARFGFAPGQIVTGTIIEVRPIEVLVDIGYKSEGIIAGNEFDDIKKLRPALNVVSPPKVTVIPGSSVISSFVEKLAAPVMLVVPSKMKFTSEYAPPAIVPCR